MEKYQSPFHHSFVQAPLPFGTQGGLGEAVKYNTPLPSSAATELFFSQGSDVLRPKRSSLTASNFNQLVFMKDNFTLLDMEKTVQEIIEES